jgi:hypothetical protein
VAATKLGADRPHEHARRKLGIAVRQIAKGAFPYLPSATLVVVGTLLAFYGLFDLGEHYQAQGDSHTETILDHRLASHAAGAVSFVTVVALIAIGMSVDRRIRGRG